VYLVEPGNDERPLTSTLGGHDEKDPPGRRMVVVGNGSFLGDRLRALVVGAELDAAGILEHRGER
jgi:hypothetical protein